MERTEHGRVARLVIAGATAGLISLTVAAFDSDGVVYTSPGAPGHGASAGAIALEPSGSFYVSGKSTDNVDPTQQRFHIRRYTANGGLNPAFEVNLQHSGSLSVARRALLAHPDGGVVAALTLANANSPQDSYTRIVRYSDNGANTAAFADFEFDNSLRYDQLDVLAMQNDGKILAAGASAGALQTGGSAVVARINVDGSIDTSFSADGYVRVEPNLVSPTFAQRSYAAISFTSVNLLEDGRIFLAGTASDTSSNDSEMLFWRLLPDGSPDTSFNGGAPLLFAVRDGNNAGAANTVGGADVAPDGTFLIGGRSTAGGTGRAWLLLFSPDGTLLSSQNESFGFDQLFDVQLLPNGGVVAVGTYALSPAQPLVAVFSDGLQFSGLFFDPLGSSRTNALYATAYDPNEQRLLSVGLGVAEAPAPILAQWLVLATPIVSNDLDVSPEPFSFTLQSNVTPGTIVESEIVEISGVDEFVRIPARVFNGEATVQGRDFSDPSLTPPYYGVLRYVTPSGNPPALSAQLRHTAADGIANTERITALTAGGVVRSTNLALTVGATQTGQMKSVTEPTANPAGKIAFTTVSTGQVEGTTAILVVQRFVGDIGAVGVSYAITDDAGGAVVASGTLDWADADSSPRYVELPTIDDAIVQGPRNYTATLSTPTGGATLVNPFVATITIQDNDTPPTPGPTAVPTAMPTSAPTPTPLPTATPTPTPTVAPTPSPEPTPSATPIPKPGSARVTDADTSVREGQPARFTVRRVGGSSGAVSVHYAVLPGTAVPVTDYQDHSGTLRWADGDADPRVITIGTVDNLAADGVRTFEFRLSDAAGGLALGSPVSVITTITDDDFAAEPVTRFELSLTDGRIVSVTTSDGSLANVRTVPAPGGLPADFDYPIDFIGFDIERLAPGATVEVTLLLPEGVDADAYVKCGDEGCAPFAGATIAGRSVTLSLTDGGDGDGDGAANGTIRDPGTPARALDAPARSSGGGALSGALLAGLLLPVLWRRASGTLASLQT